MRRNGTLQAHGVVTPDHMHELARAWATLRLSVETPDRVPAWNAVILTAASPSQAAIYEHELESARRRGQVGATTRTFVAPDPDGRRIGSGGATLNALRMLAESQGRDMAGLCVLLIHAGGDSRRLPWANVLGKPFVPLPILANADHSVPTLFDHILAMAAPIAGAMRRGGLLVLSGDVLPLFASSRLALPTDGGLVVTTPASQDVAGRHGVIVADDRDRVTALLQKPSPEDLLRSNALVSGGAALLDTGVYVFTGRTFDALAGMATESPDPVADLLKADKEISVYEEIAAALVPGEREWLARRPLGPRLIQALGRGQLAQHLARDMAFVHLGHTAEALEHLNRFWHGRLSRRVMAECGPHVADSAVVLASSLAPGARVGGLSLVYASRLGDSVRIGNRCVVVGADLGEDAFDLPADCCLWQASVLSPRGCAVTACCGVDDNPKAALGETTYLNRDFASWMQEHGVTPEMLWEKDEPRTVWTARLFPATSPDAGTSVTAWLLGDGRRKARGREAWVQAKRISMASLHGVMDVSAQVRWRDGLVADLVLRALRSALDGSVERNVAALASQLGTDDLRRRAADLVERVTEGGAEDGACAPASRMRQIRADLLAAGGYREEARAAGATAFAAVQQEVASAVRHIHCEPVSGLTPGRQALVEMPVRFDFAGGWSDTPPYCIERPAAVLNMAMSLNGQLPIGAQVEALAEPRWELILGDRNQSATLTDPEEAATIGQLKDPFMLLRAALVLTGFGSRERLTQGVRVRTWSRVPKGSGLGASSILGAALVRALQMLAGRGHDAPAVSDLVLNLEQMMTTGGGWQDQIGALVPGIKMTTSAPVRPIRLRVEPVPIAPAVLDELHRRFVLAFTGQDRLAKDVLQIVVGRYLRRDAQAVSAVERLTELAREGRQALALGDLDEFGAVLDEVWHVHQQLDPHCSNPDLDALFDAAREWSCGMKLAGAGGGGFMGVLARDAEAADRVRAALREASRDVVLYDWRLWTG